MTKKLQAILEELEDSGTSESLAVADCLLSIAENGEESDEDEFLLGCAEEIRNSAQSVIDRMRKGEL